MKIACIALVLASCTPAAPARPGSPPAMPAVAIPASPAAGLYWIPYATCATCETPAALAAYFADDVAEARAIANRLEGALPLGLPFVVHAGEVGVTGDRLVVALGAYPRRAEAEAAVRAAPAIGARRAEVVELNADVGSMPDRHVVRIDRGPRVPAWSRADVDQIEQAADESTDAEAHRTIASRRAWVLDRLRAKQPACTVGPGDLFVATTDELRWYEYAPVRCGDVPAYVAWTATLLGHAAIVPDGTGHRLHQVVGAQCDSPIIESWRYDARGRHREPPTDDARPVVAGC